MRARGLVLLTAFILTGTAYGSSPYDDANYFLDADSLGVGGGLDGKTLPDDLPIERRAFCDRGESDIATNLDSSADGKIAFANPAGFFGAINKKFGIKLFNTGACWWHTRFQRSSAYLANFFPLRPKPTDAQATKLIAALVDMKDVVEIPGYDNLFEFTTAYEKQIEAKFNSWMLGDWLTGHGLGERPFDTSSVNPADLRGSMDALYERLLARRQLIFLRIHSSADGAFDSHALLLTDLVPLRAAALPDNPLAALTPVGYRLTVIDSNGPTSIGTIDYHFGEGNMRYCSPAGGPCLGIVPRIDFDSDLAAIDHAVAAYCRPPRK